MKLSAVLAISVPIAAASQLPAIAAEPAPPVGGSNWLQNSLSELAPAKAKMSTTSYSASQKHIPVSAARVAHAAPAASAVKLRPFTPGRYLPSERDLRAAAMQAQQAQYDPSVNQQPQQMAYAQAPGAMLSGQVSSQYATQRARSAYDQYAMNPQGLAAAAMPIAQRVKAQVKRAIGQRAPRVMANQPMMVPEQITQQVPMIQAQMPEPPVQQRQMRAPFSMPVGQYQQSNMAMQQQQMMQQFQMQQQMQMQQQQMPQQQMQQMPMQQQQAMQNFAPADISPAEANAMFRQCVANPPQARLGINGELTGQAMDNPANGVGQPPFPLNFLGGNAMGQLSQGQHPANVQQARFGSWHGGNGLASAGFQSYVARRKPMMYEYSRAPIAATHKGAIAAKHPSAHAAHSAPQVVARAKAPSGGGQKAPIKVASYPAYTSYRSY